MINQNQIKLMPLTLAQLYLLRDNLDQLEKDLSITYKGEAIEGFMLTYLDELIKEISHSPTDYMYMTFWLIVRNSDQTVVGSAAFKGLPNTHHEIEIGYGLASVFEHHGYMTEAVGKMCEWGLAQQTVHTIIAETEGDNMPSQKVLLRNGFEKYLTGDTYWYKLCKKQ